MRRAVFFSLAVLLVAGCATQKDAAANFNATNVSAACSNNVYLKKYNCSAEQVQQAAEDGDADAQYALGYMYYYGIGITSDTQTAQLWISKSAAQGQPLAKKALAIMQGTITTPATPNASTALAQAAPGGGPNAAKFVASKTGYVNRVASSKAIADPRLKRNALPNTKTITATDVASAKVKRASVKVGRAPVAAKRQSQVARSRIAAPVHIHSMSADIPATGYTLQLMGSHSLAAVKVFIARHRLSGDLKVFETKYHDAPWFSLVYGHYSSIDEAKAALSQMPRAMKERRPWVKSFGTIKQEIQQHRVLS